MVTQNPGQDLIQIGKADVLIGRRGFLSGIVYSLTSIIAGALGVTSALYLFRTPKNQRQTGWVDAGEISQLKTGVPQEITFQRVRVDGWKISSEKDSAWMVKGPTGQVTAFAPQCTHLGCAYHWESNKGEFLCPCHGSVFSRTGRVVHGPAVRPLDRYEVKREGNRLWIGSIQREPKLNG